MNDETIYKLVTMLGDAISGEKSQRLLGIATEAANVRLEHENTKLRKRIAELEKQIAEYETILKPIRPEDDDRLAPWEPIPDNVQAIACGTYHTSAHFSTDDDGRLVKVESQGNAIIMDLRDMRICCRRGTWSPF